MTMHEVRFLPDNVSEEVSHSETLLDAARRAGVHISSPCGGEGNCGKCRVVVRKGEVDAPLSHPSDKMCHTLHPDDEVGAEITVHRREHAGLAKRNTLPLTTLSSWAIRRRASPLKVKPASVISFSSLSNVNPYFLRCVGKQERIPPGFMMRYTCLNTFRRSYVSGK